MINIKSKKGRYGWRSIITDTVNKIKVAGAICSLKHESRKAARIAHARTLQFEKQKTKP